MCKCISQIWVGVEKEGWLVWDGDWLMHFLFSFFLNTIGGLIFLELVLQLPNRALKDLGFSTEAKKTTVTTISIV